MRAATVAATGVAVAGGYLLGSIPVAGVVGRRHGVDPQGVGDRNPGYWNLREHLGARRAAPVFAGDVAKGVAAGVVGVLVAPVEAWGVGYCAVGAAMVGHAWPIFARFRGGRSILTWAGGMCVLSPLAGLVAVSGFVAVALTGSFAWGARLGVFAFPVVQLVVEGPYRTAATGALMSLIGLRFALAGRSPRGGTDVDVHGAGEHIGVDEETPLPMFEDSHIRQVSVELDLPVSEGFGYEPDLPADTDDPP